MLHRSERSDDRGFDDEIEALETLLQNKVWIRQHIDALLKHLKEKTEKKLDCKLLFEDILYFHQALTSHNEHHAEAEYELWRAFYNGIFVKKNIEKAYFWLNLAVSHNPRLLRLHCNQLTLLNASSPEQNPNNKLTANDYFNQGQQYYIGIDATGNETFQNALLKEAFIHFKKAAERNHTEAQVLAAECLYAGLGVKQNKVEAIRYAKNLVKQRPHVIFNFIEVLSANEKNLMNWISQVEPSRDNLSLALKAYKDLRTKEWHFNFFATHKKGNKIQAVEALENIIREAQETKTICTARLTNNKHCDALLDERLGLIINKFFKQLPISIQGQLNETKKQLAIKEKLEMKENAFWVKCHSH